jgi:hypothetical protein
MQIIRRVRVLEVSYFDGVAERRIVHQTIIGIRRTVGEAVSKWVKRQREFKRTAMQPLQDSLPQICFVLSNTPGEGVRANF